MLRPDLLLRDVRVGDAEALAQVLVTAFDAAFFEPGPAYDLP